MLTCARYAIHSRSQEYYMLRSIFEESYPGPWPLATVPFGKSIACSTPEAISWDPKWATTSGDIRWVRVIDIPAACAC
jgi:asparagine synthase (glutamine-hydrolysing)